MLKRGNPWSDIKTRTIEELLTILVCVHAQYYTCSAWKTTYVDRWSMYCNGRVRIRFCFRQKTTQIVYTSRWVPCTCSNYHNTHINNYVVYTCMYMYIHRRRLRSVQSQGLFGVFKWILVLRWKAIWGENSKWAHLLHVRSDVIAADAVSVTLARCHAIGRPRLSIKLLAISRLQSIKSISFRQRKHHYSLCVGWR